MNVKKTIFFLDLKIIKISVYFNSHLFKYNNYFRQMKIQAYL